MAFKSLIREPFQRQSMGMGTAGALFGYRGSCAAPWILQRTRFPATEKPPAAGGKMRPVCDSDRGAAGNRALQAGNPFDRQTIKELKRC